MSRWDAARHKRAGHQVTTPNLERLTWRCLNPKCRGKLPDTRIGYCSDTCSETDRARIRTERLKGS